LFGRHISDGADGNAAKGEFGDGEGGGIGKIRAGGRERFKFGEAEVEQFGVALLGDENVGGFDIAMDDTTGVRGFESRGNLNTPLEGGSKSEGPISSRRV